MKKLMIALAAAAMAVGVQASQMDWKALYRSEALNLDGATAYLFNAKDRAAVSALLGEFTTANELTAYALKFEGVTTVLNGVAEFDDPEWVTDFEEGTVQGITSSDSVFAILFRDDIKIGTGYLMSEDKAVADYVYEKGAGAPKTLNIKNTAYTTIGTIEGVPEPTSGLLLLLGVAGLALKRKRA